MDYKKSIKSQKLRLKILQSLSFLPDKAKEKVHFYVSGLTGAVQRAKFPMLLHYSIGGYFGRGNCYSVKKQ